MPFSFYSLKKLIKNYRILEMRTPCSIHEKIDLERLNDLSKSTEHALTMLGSYVLVRKISTSCYDR